MADFVFDNSTTIFFGKDCQKQIGSLVAKHCLTKTVMIVSYQGRPLAALMDEITRSINEAGYKTVEFEGVVPNPLLDKALEGIALARENDVGMLIGVGGGSAIDTAKAIALGCRLKKDLWPVYMGEAEPDEILPVGAVMTLAGTGSETSIFAVLTNPEIPLKIGYGTDEMRPKFALLNPELTYSVNRYQTACGACDMFAHILDAYLGRVDDMPLSYRMSEAVLATIIEYAKVAVEDPTNYMARSQLMLSGTLAMGKYASMGLDTNLGLHTMAEDLGAMYNVTHGAALAVLIPAWLNHLRGEKFALLVRYAANVWGIAPDAGDLNRSIDQAIARTKAFFVSLGLPVTLGELNIDFEKDGRMLADRITCVGDYGDSYMQLTTDEVYEIYKYAR